MFDTPNARGSSPPRRTSRPSSVAHAHARDAAHARRERAATRCSERAQILDLLRRGAGITQILRETAQRSDRAGDRLARARRLRSILHAVAAGDAPGVSLKAPKLQRALRYLDVRVAVLQAEAEWSRHNHERRASASLAHAGEGQGDRT